MGMPHYIIQDVVYETLNDDSINVNLSILEEDNSINDMTDEEYLQITRNENHDKKFNSINEINQLLATNDFIADTKEKCSICLNKYQENNICRKLNNCQHYFHKNCINEWLLFKGNCPCCRTFCK